MECEPGDQTGLEAFNDAPDTLEMCNVEIVRTVQRQADAVQRQRIVVADGVKTGEPRPATHVVLGVNFQPRHRGARIDDRLMMREAQPDPRHRGDRAAFRTC